MTERTRYDEYLICKERGHDPLPIVMPTNPPKRKCSRCRTTYWTTTTLHESNAPKPEVAA